MRIYTRVIQIPPTFPSNRHEFNDIRSRQLSTPSRRPFIAQFFIFPLASYSVHSHLSKRFVLDILVILGISIILYCLVFYIHCTPSFCYICLPNLAAAPLSYPEGLSCLFFKHYLSHQLLYFTLAPSTVSFILTL